MNFTIKNRVNLSVIFECEADSIKLAVGLAVKQKANLRYADLSSANLSSADLRYADLSSADLSSANLRYADLSSANLSSANLSSADLSSADLSSANLRSANLSSANLSSANLRSANLRSANLSYANLSYANLSSADLSSANLRSADLSSANLSYANLSSADLRYADLSSAKGINKHLVTPLLLLLDQPGKIRAYKLVKPDGQGPFNGGITYEVGKSYQAEANTNENDQCAKGINLATLDWCMKEWKQGYRILLAEFKSTDIAAIPISTDGKFRVHRCTIVGEKDLIEIGLVKK